MRHKRLSRAEEKAYALPAKLSMPLMICVFPVLFVVILLPVFVTHQNGRLLTVPAQAKIPLRQGQLGRSGETFLTTVA